MFDKVHFAGPICIPQIDREDIKGRIDLIDIDLFFSLCISDNQADAGRRRDWSSILIAKATHASSNRLLHHLERPDAALVDGRNRGKVVRRSHRTG